MNLRSFRLPALALIGLACAFPVRAQLPGPLTLNGGFVNVHLNSTGDLIVWREVSPGVFTKDDSSGIEFGTVLDGPKKEIAGWAPRAAESWCLRFNTPNGHVGINNGYIGSMLAADVRDPRKFDIFFPKRATAGLFEMDLYDDAIDFGGNKVINLQQIASYDYDAKIVRFDISITNISNETLTGLTYLRSINPKQGVPDFSILDTVNKFNSPFFPGGTAVDSTINGVSESDSLQRHLGLGSDVEGTRVNSGGDADSNTEVSIDDLETGYNPIAGAFFKDGKKRYGELAGFDASGNPIYNSFNESEAFVSGAFALNLWKHLGDLAPGETVNYNLYYVMGGPSEVPEVPEPGAMGLLAGAVFACGGFALRRFRSRN